MATNLKVVGTVTTTDTKKEEKIVDYIKSIKELEDTMEPFKEQKRDLKKNYVDNGWLTKEEISTAVKAFRLMKGDVDLDQMRDFFNLYERTKVIQMKYVPLNRHLLLEDVENTEKSAGVLVPDDYKIIKNFGIYRVVDFSLDCDTFFEAGEDVVVEENMVREVELDTEKKYYVITENLVVLRGGVEEE